MERGIVHFDPYPKIILFSPSVSSIWFEQGFFHLLLLSNKLLSKLSQTSKSNSTSSKMTSTSRLGFSSCLLLLHFDCRLPVFLVETWTASYFWARLRQRTAPRLPASHIFKKESYFQLFLYRLASHGQNQPTLMLHILRPVADQTGATSIIIIHHLHHSTISTSTTTSVTYFQVCHRAD